jgi:hypothetical protein
MNNAINGICQTTEDSQRSRRYYCCERYFFRKTIVDHFRRPLPRRYGKQLSFPAGLRTCGHKLKRASHPVPTHRRFPGHYDPVLNDGSRFHLPLRGSPGFSPGSHFQERAKQIFKQLHRQRRLNIRKRQRLSISISGSSPFRRNSPVYLTTTFSKWSRQIAAKVSIVFNGVFCASLNDMSGRLSLGMKFWSTKRFAPLSSRQMTWMSSSV